MKVLFAIIPGHGHFFPYIPLANALKEAGHVVEFATSKSYGPTIEDYGFTAIPAGIDYTQGSVEWDDADTDPIEKLMFVDGPPVMFQDLMDLFADNPVDVVLVDPTEAGSIVAAEASQIPFGGIVPGRRNGFVPGMVPFDPAERPGSFVYVGRQTYDELRAEAGLDPMDLLLGEYGYDRTFSLCMAPESFNGWPLPAQHHTSHSLRPEVHRSDSDDSWLDDLPTDLPVVAVSFGTLFGSSELYTDAARALLDLDAHVVVATSYDVDVEHERLTKVKWVSMDRLMDRADISVHHAGWGSTVAALATGTPSVVVPIGADQFTNAQGFKNTGAGRVVARDRIADDLANAVSKVLGSDVYRINAQRIKAEIDAMPSAAEVVPLVERLAEDGIVMNKSGS